MHDEYTISFSIRSQPSWDVLVTQRPAAALFAMDSAPIRSDKFTRDEATLGVAIVIAKTFKAAEMSLPVDPLTVMLYAAYMFAFYTANGDALSHLGPLFDALSIRSPASLMEAANDNAGR